VDNKRTVRFEKAWGRSWRADSRRPYLKVLGRVSAGILNVLFLWLLRIDYSRSAPDFTSERLA